MSTIEEKRVYGDREGAVDAYVASEMGVVRVAIAGDAVGEFRLIERCEARDIAATQTRVAVATATDVLVLHTDADAEKPATETGFGPAIAVGIDASSDEQTILAASPSGTVSRYREGSWTPLAVDSKSESPTTLEVRAIDGELCGTNAGIYRCQANRLVHAGLSAVRDVSVAGVPLAATADGLYKLGNGWMCERSGEFRAVAVNAQTPPGRLEGAVAVSGGGTVFAYQGDEADSTGWVDCPSPSEPIVDLAVGACPYAVSADGQFLALTDREWRPHHLGVRGVRALALGVKS